MPTAPPPRLGIEKLAGGGSATAVVASVADKEAVKKMIYDAVESRGGLDILVNNAGVSRPNMLWNLTDEQWDEVIATNLSSQFYAVRAATNAWMKDHGGAIVNVSSLAGLRAASPGQLRVGQSRRPRPDQGGRIGSGQVRHSGQRRCAGSYRHRDDPHHRWKHPSCVNATEGEITVGSHGQPHRHRRSGGLPGRAKCVLDHG